MDALNTYFDSVLRMPEVCQHKIFKSFITPSDRVNTQPPDVQPTAPSLSKSLKKSEEFYEQVVDDYRGMMVSIDNLETNIDDYELVKRQNRYISAVASVSFDSDEKLVRGVEWSGEVDEGGFEWIESAFQELLEVSGSITTSRLIHDFNSN